MRPSRIVAAPAAFLAVLAVSCGGGNPAPTSPGATTRTPLVSYRLHVGVAPFALPAPVQREVAVLSGGTIYLAGGLDSLDRSTNGVFGLDPATGKLTMIGTMPRAFHDATGAIIAGKLFVFGGGHLDSSDAVQRFDLAEGSLGQVAGHLPTALSDVSSAIVGGTAYLVGGYDGTSAQSAIYATTDGTSFHQVGTLPQGLRYAAVAAVGSALVIAGGVTDAGPVSAVLRFDPATGKVSALGDLPAPIGHAAAFTLNGRVFIAGGMNAAGSAVRTVTMIDPAAGTIRPIRPLARAVSDPGVAAGPDGAWLLGGWRGTTLTQVLHVTLVRTSP